jgi:Flp pilus assembly pilin Flp
MGFKWLETAVRIARGSKEAGATAVEYAIVASLIAGVVVASVTIIGRALAPLFLAAQTGL